MGLRIDINGRIVLLARLLSIRRDRRPALTLILRGGKIEFIPRLADEPGSGGARERLRVRTATGRVKTR